MHNKEVRKSRYATKFAHFRPMQDNCGIHAVNRRMSVRDRIRKDISLEEVIRLYREEGWTAHQIAEKYGVWPQTIFRWLRKEEVPRRPAHRKPPSVDPKVLKDLYYRRKYTLGDIARELNVSKLTVWAWFKRFNIQRRPRGHWSKREQIS